MNSKLKTNESLVDGPIFYKMILFAVPIMLTGILQLAYNMADNIVVGRFSSDTGALAAVGSVGTLYNLTMNFLLGLAAGVGVVIAQFFGARDARKVSRTLHTSVVASLVSGIIFAAIAFALSRPVLTLMGTKPEILDKAVLYFRIICIGIPASALYNCGAAVMRAVGDSRSPLIILASTGIVNVALNLVFVIIFHMSVVGVAIATITSQYLSAIVVMMLLMKKKGESYCFSLSSLCFDGGLILRVLRIGLPAAIQSAMFSVSNMLMASAVNTFPTTTVSANTIASNIDGIAYTTMNSFSQTALTFAGQNWGAAKPKRIRKIYLYGVLLVTGVGIAIGQIVLLFVEPLASLYINPADENYALIIATVKEIAALLLSTYFICGIMDTLSGFMRGLGYSLSPMIISITSVCVLRVLWIYLVFPIEAMNNIVGLYISYPVSWSAALVCFGVLSVFAFKKIRSLECSLATKGE